MKLSLATRIQRSFFIIMAVVVLVSYFMFDRIYEQTEDMVVQAEMRKQRDRFLSGLDNLEYSEWRTDTELMVFLGQGQPQSRLPPEVRGYPVPFFAEIETAEKEQVIMIERMNAPSGVLYMVHDTAELEAMDDALELALTLAIAVIMLGIGFGLARVSVRKILQPLERLTAQLQASDPKISVPRLPQDYAERELQEIAGSFNRFFDKLEEHVAREKTFVRLASHELRTPLAVISGALDVIGKRGTLSAEDRKTFNRIRKSAEDMKSDVEMLLKLARGENELVPLIEVPLRELAELVISDLEDERPDWSGRTALVSTSGARVMADESLSRVLLRNLIQNALKHTEGAVEVALDGEAIHVRDAGGGMPAHEQARLRSTELRSMPGQSESGSGLLLIKLICERLSWRLHLDGSDARGTRISVFYRRTPT
jgi:signal transduction histidine kinase